MVKKQNSLDTPLNLNQKCTNDFFFRKMLKFIVFGNSHKREELEINNNVKYIQKQIKPFDCLNQHHRISTQQIVLNEKKNTFNFCFVLFILLLVFYINKNILVVDFVHVILMKFITLKKNTKNKTENNMWNNNHNRIRVIYHIRVNRTKCIHTHTHI